MERVLPKQNETARPLDVDLVIGARSGDRAAFELLIAGRAERAFRTAMAIQGHEADARDATQEAYVKTWRDLPHSAMSSASMPGSVASSSTPVGAPAADAAAITFAKPRTHQSSARWTGWPMDPRDVSRTGRRIWICANEPTIDSPPTTALLLVLHHMDHRPVAQIPAAPTTTRATGTRPAPGTAIRPGEQAVGPTVDDLIADIRANTAYTSHDRDSTSPSTGTPERSGGSSSLTRPRDDSFGVVATASHDDRPRRVLGGDDDVSRLCARWWRTGRLTRASSRGSAPLAIGYLKVERRRLAGPRMVVIVSRTPGRTGPVDFVHLWIGVVVLWGFG